MFKVISAELKKMVSKPGIYILSCLLALVLVMGVLVYKPSVYESSSYTLPGSTFTEKYDAYFSDGRKEDADSYIANALNTVNAYLIEGSTYKQRIDSNLEAFEESYLEYKNCMLNNAGEAIVASFKKDMIQNLQSLHKTISNALELSKEGSYVLITTNANFKVYDTTYAAINKLFNTDASIQDICTEYSAQYKDIFLTAINSMITPAPSQEMLNRYTANTNSRYATIQDRLNAINTEISTIKAAVTSDPTLEYDITTKAKMDRLSNQYTNMAKTYANLVRYELLDHAYSYVGIRDKSDLMYMGTNDTYNIRNNLMKFDYLFVNNYTDAQFAHPLTIGVSSNPETNAYDYTYFVLKVFSFIIIAYAIMTGCHTLAGEIKEGSMRYIAIRPTSRASLFFGKLFAILTMSIILTVFSSIIAAIVGGVVYGFESLQILTIFNGQYVLHLHPIAMLAIYLVSFVFELFIYLSIAMMFSALLKSDLFAVTIMLVLYLLNILLPLFVVGPTSWLGYYPFSHVSLYSLFGSSLYILDNNPFASLLGCKVYTTTNVWLTGGIILALIMISIIVGARIFKRKEL